MAHDIKLGQLVDETQGRDAVHIAIAPVVAAEQMYPGEHVGLLPDGRVSTSAEPHIGIADPFLTRRVQPGDRLLVMLYPNTITTLRHEWTHPAFAALVPAVVALSPIDESRIWLEKLAANLDLTLNALLAAAERWIMDEEYTTQQGSEHWRNTFYEYADAFWPHYQRFTGRTVVKEKQEAFFSCSC
jgi:hypothetical protein